MLFTLRLGIVAAALVAAVLPLAPPVVERFYSGWIYPAWQRASTSASNQVPFALLDVLIVLVAARVAFLLLRIFRARPRIRAALGSLLRLASLGALIYLAFLLSWGLNYRRVPLASGLDYSPRRVTPQAAAALARRVVAGANRLHDGSGGGGSRTWDEVAAGIAPSFARVQQQLGRESGAVPGRAKASLLTFYFERAGVDGMTDPFFLEVLVNRELLPFERPAVLAHEWAHLAGYADESEANFVGWLVCLQGPPAAQYSAHLAILWDLIGALPAPERERAVRDLGQGPKEDLRAVAERVSRTTEALRQVSWKVYDRYLKANRVEAGVNSYGEALRLLLGTRMGPGWKPAVRKG